MKLGTIAASALLAALGAPLAWPWVQLGVHASNYPVTAAEDTANVVIDGMHVFSSRAEGGFEAIDLRSGNRISIVPPPNGSESVDDLAIADRFLFALDARTPGHLSVYSIQDPATPILVSGPVAVPVGPFSGVSAAGGRVIVSGGTSEMTLRTYDAHGKLSDVIATADFGRGQPDVLLAPDGTRAFVSTHDWGPYFELTTVRVADSLEKISSIDLDTYGFTDGGTKPANFPLETAIDGDTLLIADGSGLTVVSGADPAKPRVLAKLDLGLNAVNVDVRDRIAAIVGSSPKPRLVLVDISSPSKPQVIRSIDLPERSRSTGVAIGAAHIAVASQQQVLIIPKETK